MELPKNPQDYLLNKFRISYNTCNSCTKVKKFIKTMLVTPEMRERK